MLDICTFLGKDLFYKKFEYFKFNSFSNQTSHLTTSRALECYIVDSDFTLRERILAPTRPEISSLEKAFPTCTRIQPGTNHTLINESSHFNNSKSN
jgi:hypothetical protein